MSATRFFTTKTFPPVIQSVNSLLFSEFLVMDCESLGTMINDTEKVLGRDDNLTTIYIYIYIYISFENEYTRNSIHG